MTPQAVPLHPAPVTPQEMPLLGFEFGAGISVAVNCALVPAFTEAGPVSPRVKLLVTLTRALADFDGSARLRAVSVTPAGVGRTCGAVRSPLGSTVPQAAPEHPGPEVLQLTARSGLPEPVMLARNCWVAPSSTLAVAGET